MAPVGSEDAVAQERSNRVDGSTMHDVNRWAQGPTDIDPTVREYRPEGDLHSYRVALDALDTGREMWPRSEFDPGHFTASGFVASPDGKALLLIHHGKLDRWLQPGGHMEAVDGCVEDAARREVLEETGVGDLVRIGSSLVRIDAHTIPERGDEPEHIHIDLAVGFISPNDAIGPLDEVKDACWVRFEDLDDYDVDGGVLGGVDALRRLLAG